MKIARVLGNNWAFIIMCIILTGLNLGNSIYQQQVSALNIIATAIYFIAAFLYGYFNVSTGTGKFYLKIVLFWTAILVALALANAMSIFPFLFCLIFVIPAYGFIYYVQADSVFQVIAVCYIMASLMAAGYYIAKIQSRKTNRKQ